MEGGISTKAGQWLTWWRVSGGELQQLGSALRELQSATPAPDATAAGVARADLALLSDRVAEAEVRCAALQADCQLLRTLAGGRGIF